MSDKQQKMGFLEAVGIGILGLGFLIMVMGFEGDLPDFMLVILGFGTAIAGGIIALLKLKRRMPSLCGPFNHSK